MLKKFIYIVFLVFLFVVSQQVIGQDVHYSQMYSSPLFINPAFTGNHVCDFRAGVNYRTQAASFTVPFETYSAWGDARVYPEFLGRRAWMGLGGHMYYDNAGDGGLKKIQGMAFGSFSQGFNADNSFYGSLGVGLGVTNRSINVNKLIFNNQWDDIGLNFDPTLPNGEALASSSIFYMDFNMGLAVHHLVNEKFQYEFGVSMSHINKPEESFYGEKNKVGRKLIVNASVQTLLSKKILLKPEAYFVTHEGAEEIIFGANMVYGTTDIKLHGGLWYRFGRDIIPTLGLEYSTFTALFSYDINVSKQRIASNYQGGFELSILKRFCYSSRKSTKREPCKFLEF